MELTCCSAAGSAPPRRRPGSLRASAAHLEERRVRGREHDVAVALEARHERSLAGRTCGRMRHGQDGRQKGFPRRLGPPTRLPPPSGKAKDRRREVTARMVEAAGGDALAIVGHSSRPSAGEPKRLLGFVEMAAYSPCRATLRGTQYSILAGRTGRGGPGRYAPRSRSCRRAARACAWSAPGPKEPDRGPANTHRERVVVERVLVEPR